MRYIQIDTLWDREMRNAISSMFEELYSEYRYSGLNAQDAFNQAKQALIDATESRDIAEKTRKEMLAIIREQTQNGDLAPEIAQSRNGFETLGERLASFDSLIDEFDKGVAPLIDGVRTSTNGNMSMTTLLKPVEELLPYFKDNNLAGDTSEDAVNKLYESLSTDDIYDLYDRLVIEDKKLRHGHTWGHLDDDTPLRWYHFEPSIRYTIPKSTDSGESRFDVYNRLLASKPVLFITSAIHGNEKTNVWALYLTIKDILEGKTELDRHIRRNYEIVVLPACNPYGIDNNTRNNENGVNINRNLPYKWESDDSDDKGSEPFSEYSSQFIRDIRDKFIDDLDVKQGMLFVDSHDFNYTNYKNDRVLWVGANDQKLRRTLMNAGGIIEEKLTKMYPDLVTGEDQDFFNLGATGVGYGATLNAWNWDSRVTGYSLECVNNLTSLGVSGKYSIESARIGYIVVRDFILQTTLDHSGRIPDTTLVGFENALSNEDDDFLTTLHSIPSGRSLVAGVYNRENIFSEYMPEGPDGETYLGVFRATKSNGSKSNSGFMEFTTTNYKYPRKFYASFNQDEFTEWFEIGRGVVNTVAGSLGLGNSATIIDLFDAMGENQMSELYVTPSTTGINSQLSEDTPVEYGSIKITKNTHKTGYVEHTTYSQSRNRRFVSSISGGKLTDWTEILTREEKIKTGFKELDLSDSSATITDVFQRLKNDQFAKLYVTGVTEGIHSQLPDAVNVKFGTIEIIRNTDKTGSVEHTTYSSSRNRRFFTSISNGKLTGWTEMLTESVK